MGQCLYGGASPRGLPARRRSGQPGRWACVARRRTAPSDRWRPASVGGGAGQCAASNPVMPPSTGTETGQVRGGCPGGPTGHRAYAVAEGNHKIKHIIVIETGRTGSLRQLLRRRTPGADERPDRRTGPLSARRCTSARARAHAPRRRWVLTDGHHDTARRTSTGAATHGEGRQPALPDVNNGAMNGIRHPRRPQPKKGSVDNRWEVVVMDSTAGGHGPDVMRLTHTASGDPELLEPTPRTSCSATTCSGSVIGTWSLARPPPTGVGLVVNAKLQPSAPDIRTRSRAAPGTDAQGARCRSTWTRPSTRARRDVTNAWTDLTWLLYNKHVRSRHGPSYVQTGDQADCDAHARAFRRSRADSRSTHRTRYRRHGRHGRILGGGR